MTQELIEEKIQELQSDTKLCFKQTNEIIEIAYRKALKDCDEPIQKSKSSSKEKELESSIEEQLKIIADLKKQLEISENKNQVKEESKNTKTLKKGGKFSSTIEDQKSSIEHKKEIIDAKLEVYNKVYDMIYFDKCDLLSLYQKIKEEIDKLNEKAENISVSKYGYRR